MEQTTLKQLIDLAERFLPKEIAVDNPKQLAMYELYHRLKQELNTAQEHSLTPNPLQEPPEAEDEDYDPNWMKVIEKVEKDNTACVAYCDTVKWLKKYFTITKNMK